MALHEINIALGPEATINMLLEKYPERHFLKYKSLDDHRKFMLLDVSGEKTVFQSGLNYRFIQTLGEVELSENAILELRYMTLDSDEQKVMQSILGTMKKSVRSDSSPMLSCVRSSKITNIC